MVAYYRPTKHPLNTKLAAFWAATGYHLLSEKSQLVLLHVPDLTESVTRSGCRPPLNGTHFPITLTNENVSIVTRLLM